MIREVSRDDLLSGFRVMQDADFKSCSYDINPPYIHLKTRVKRPGGGGTWL